MNKISKFKFCFLDVVSGLFIILFSLIVFFPSLSFEFIRFDDTSHLTRNPYTNLVNFNSFLEIFRQQVNYTYIPLTILSFAIERHFFGLNPFVFHLNNLILHILVSVMVFILGLRLGLSRIVAVFAALVFAIHPMHVESVVWVTERKDVLYSFFYLLSVLFYLRYVSLCNKKAYVLSVLFAFLSILSKPMALSLPLILILLDWFEKRQFSLKMFLDKLAYFLVIVPVVYLTYKNHVRVPFSDLREAILMGLWTSTFYIKKFFYPNHFSPLYEQPRPISILTLDYQIGLLILLILCFILIRYRKNRWVVFSIFYYFLSMFFLIRYDFSKDMNVVADRFMYLPSLGFCLLLGYFLDALFQKGSMIRRKLIFLSATFLIVVLSVISSFQMQIWKNSFVFCNALVWNLPNSSIGYQKRSFEYQRLGNIDLAIKDLNHVLTLNPRASRAWNNLGSILLGINDVDRALFAFNNAIENGGNRFSEFYINRGGVYLFLREDDKALKDFNQAIMINDASIKAYFQRGNSYLNLKKYSLALNDYSQVILLTGDSPDALSYRALIYNNLWRVVWKVITLGK